MATVPGTPEDNVGFMHPAFRPTQADFLQAAAIMHGQGKFQVAGDVIPFGGIERQRLEMSPEEYRKKETQRVLGRALQKEGTVTPLPITPKSGD